MSYNTNGDKSAFAPPPEMNVSYQPHAMPMPQPQPQAHAMPQPQYQPQDHQYQPQPPYQPHPQPPYQPQPHQQPPYQPQQPGYPYPPGPAGAQGYQPVPQGPIVSQPGGMGDPSGWMNMPTGTLMPVGCPPGLEYLTTIDQLLVKQKVELLEAFTGFETNNKFTIKNSLGQKVYWAVEENDCCTRNCCGPARPFDMKVMDTYKTEVIHMSRPLACSTCWFPCCLQSMEVSAPPGNVIGRVEQEWSLCYPSFAIKNHSGETVLRIEGPICTFSICGDVEFKIVTMNGDEVGKISKQWSGLAREMFTDADFFGISFPMDLDVRMKAVMLGACFLIDAMFFEKSGNQENDRPGMF